MKKIVFGLMLVLGVFAFGQERHKEVEKLQTAKQNFKEIGILDIDIRFPVKIYAHPKNKNHFDEIIFNKITSGISEGSHTIEINEALKPYIIRKGTSYSRADLGYIYPELKFRVLSKTDEYFEVLVNEETQEIGYIKIGKRKVFNSSKLTFWEEKYKIKEKNDNHFIFIDWKDYLKRAEFISVRKRDIYDKINGNIIYKSVDNIFKVTDVEGDWLKGTPPPNRPINTDKSGWIKWRDNGKLLIIVTEYTVE